MDTLMSWLSADRLAMAVGLLLGMLLGFLVH